MEQEQLQALSASILLLLQQEMAQLLPSVADRVSRQLLQQRSATVPLAAPSPSQPPVHAQQPVPSSPSPSPPASSPVIVQAGYTTGLDALYQLTPSIEHRRELLAQGMRCTTDKHQQTVWLYPTEERTRVQQTLQHWGYKLQYKQGSDSLPVDIEPPPKPKPASVPVESKPKTVPASVPVTSSKAKLILSHNRWRNFEEPETQMVFQTVQGIAKAVGVQDHNAGEDEKGLDSLFHLLDEDVMQCIKRGWAYDCSIVVDD